MARKASDSESARGFDDIIGVALLAATLLLLVAQWSFDRHDISLLNTPPNHPTHNWIGPLGAYIAWASFLPFGVVGYLVPLMLAMFGVAYLLDFLGYLRRRLAWSLVWSGMLLIAMTGLLYILGESGWMGKWHEKIGSQSIGGWLGWVSYGETREWRFGLSLLGRVGATIVYITLLLISVLFLTNFQLGEWIRGYLDRSRVRERAPVSNEETVLEKKARDLQKQAARLQEEVARTENERSGLGADLKPVPEPTVRDLSVPQ